MSHDGNFDRLDRPRVLRVRTFQYRSEPGVLRNPQTSAQLFGIEPGHHSGVGPGGVGNAESAKASSIVLADVPKLLETTVCRDVCRIHKLFQKSCAKFNARVVQCTLESIDPLDDIRDARWISLKNEEMKK